MLIEITLFKMKYKLKTELQQRVKKLQLFFFSNLEGIWLCSKKSIYLLKVFGVKSASDSLTSFPIFAVFLPALFI